MKIKIKNTASSYKAITIPKTKIYSADKLSQSYLGDQHEWTANIPARRDWWMSRVICIQKKYAGIKALPDECAGAMDTLKGLCLRVEKAMRMYERANCPVTFIGHQHGWAFFCTLDRKQLYTTPSQYAAWVRRRISNAELRVTMSESHGHAVCFFANEKMVAVLATVEVQPWDKRYFELKNVRV